MPGRRQKAAQMHERIRVHLPSAMLRAREHSNRSGGEAGRATAREKNGAMRAGGRQPRHSLRAGTARGLPHRTDVRHVLVLDLISVFGGAEGKDNLLGGGQIGDGGLTHPMQRRACSFGAI